MALDDLAREEEEDGKVNENSPHGTFNHGNFKRAFCYSTRKKSNKLQYVLIWGPSATKVRVWYRGRGALGSPPPPRKSSLHVVQCMLLYAALHLGTLLFGTPYTSQNASVLFFASHCTHAHMCVLVMKLFHDLQHKLGQLKDHFLLWCFECSTVTNSRYCRSGNFRC